jgi:hypothetical protein
MIWTVLWLLWAIAFITIEAIALFNDRKHDTLSFHLRLWFRTDTRIGRTVFIGITGVFFGWFIVHIAVRGSI